MMARIGKILGTVACLGLVLATGCTNSDVLNPGNGPVTVRIQGINTASHFTDEAADQAIIALGDVRIRPNEAGADAALGSNVVTLFTSDNPDSSVNFAASDSSTVGPLPLTGGTYRMASLRISRIRFRDAVQPTGGATCKEAARELTSLSTIIITPTQLGFTPNFSVNPDGNEEFTIQFDVDAFLTAFVAASSSCSPPSCACTNLNTNTLGAAASTYLSFP